MALTIAYITVRKDPKIEWFIDSLNRQAIELGLADLYVKVISPFLPYYVGPPGPLLVQCYPPKPSVWQGPHRLTKEDWFAASNSRNTALIVTEPGYLAYVDDLSVLMPGWLRAVLEHQNAGRFAFGAYGKSKKMVVRDGILISHEPHARDNRIPQVTADVTPCQGRWLYGCSLCGPVDHFLEVGGWPEICDGLGFEDCVFGHALENRGYQMVFDRRMLTIESEEDHHREPAFKRSDYGVSPNDKSHAVLNIGKQSRYFENYYAGGIRKMREDFAAGLPFPVALNPRHDWFTGKPLQEL